jgi:acyl dehydratase
MARIHDAREERFGRYLDEFEVGDVFRHWPGKTVTEADDHLFCMLTMAASPLHIDRHFAATEMPDGRNIVVGTYVYSLLLGMSVPDISGRAIANLGLSELRHLAPLFHGDTLYGETEVLGTRLSASRPAEGILTVRTDGFNQDRLKLCTFTRSVLLPVRPGDA